MIEMLPAGRKVLIEATWSEVNFNALEWRTPSESMKMDNPRIIPLSKQALTMFEELKFLVGDSPYVFPSSCNDYRCPISKTTLNCVVRSAYAGSERQRFCYS